MRVIVLVQLHAIKGGEVVGLVTKLRLTEEREARGLSKSDLARRANKQPSRVGAIENGRAIPPRGSKELRDLALVLGFRGDPDSLLAPVGERDPLA